MRQLILFCCIFSLAGCSPAGMQAFNEFAQGFSQAMADNPTPSFSAPSTYTPRRSAGNTGSSYQPYYRESDCNGPVVNGQCLGTIRPTAKGGKCYGTIINNECIGTEIDNLYRNQ